MRLRFAIVALAALELVLAADVRAAPAVGTAAPALVARSIEGQPIDLEALRGKVVIVHFWATWCPPCREEMPVLDDYYRAHRADGVEVIAASIDRKRDLGDIAKLMKPFAFPAVLLATATSNAWGAPDVMPTTYVLDRGGAIRIVMRPSKIALTKQRLSELVDPLLVVQAAGGSTP